jgi:hypothetical protein
MNCSADRARLVLRLGADVYCSDSWALPAFSQAWTHVAVVRDAAHAATFFVNGSRISSASVAPPGAAAFSGRLMLGGVHNATTDTTFAGAIADVQVFNASLDALDLGWFVRARARWRSCDDPAAELCGGAGLPLRSTRRVRANQRVRVPCVSVCVCTRRFMRVQVPRGNRAQCVVVRVRRTHAVRRAAARCVRACCLVRRRC